MNSLQYVKWDILSEEQIDEICREALKHDRCLIRYIKDKDIFNIKYLEAQGKASEVIAIKEDGGFDLEKEINVHRQVYLDFLEQFK